MRSSIISAPRTSTWSSCATGYHEGNVGSGRQRPPAAAPQSRLDHPRRQVEIAEEHRGALPVRAAAREPPDRGELPAAAPRHEGQVRGRDRDRSPRRLHRHPQCGARFAVPVEDRGPAGVGPSPPGPARAATGQRRDRDGRQRQPAEQADAVRGSPRVRVGARAPDPAQRRVAEQRGGEHPRSAEEGCELGHLVQLAGPRSARGRPPAPPRRRRQGIDGRSDRVEVDPVTAHVQAVQQVEGGDPQPSALQRGEQGPRRDVAAVAHAVDEQRGRAARPRCEPRS